VLSAEVRKLVHKTGDRRAFGVEFLQTAAGVADYSYLVLKLSSSVETTWAVHARGPWPQNPSPRTLEALELPRENAINMEVVCEGPCSEGTDSGIDFRDKVRFNVEAAGELLGSLLAVGREKRLGGDDRTTLELLAKELGLLVKNMFLLEETRRLANNDGLTDLQNRRRVAERLDLELERTRLFGTSLSLLLCDVDRFKQVNDCFGHNIGDEVLIRVASTLQETINQPDLVGRWGGEEFIVILPDTDSGGARLIAERLRRAIEALPAVVSGPDRVTCSIGCTTLEDETAAAAFVDRADQALYRAKKNGRNRVEVG
jgi:diguanylate cyclase (GGDEF)-like protein